MYCKKPFDDKFSHFYTAHDRDRLAGDDAAAYTALWIAARGNKIRHNDQVECVMRETHA